MSAPFKYLNPVNTITFTCPSVLYRLLEMSTLLSILMIVQAQFKAIL